VTLGHYSEEDMNLYIANENLWRGKAGGYSI